jgi:uncharacterized protein YkwD
MLSRRALLASVGWFAAVGRAGTAVRDLEYRVHDGINRQRLAHGLEQLRWNAALAATARNHSGRMLSTGFFAHVDPEFGDLVRRVNAAGIQWSRIAENIFREQGYDDPASQAIVGWMYSPTHRGSLLNEAFTDTGIGIAVSRDGEYFITQQFLRR